MSGGNFVPLPFFSEPSIGMDEDKKKAVLNGAFEMPFSVPQMKTDDKPVATSSAATSPQPSRPVSSIPTSPPAFFESNQTFSFGGNFHVTPSTTQFNGPLSPPEEPVQKQPEMVAPWSSPFNPEPAMTKTEAPSSFPPWQTAPASSSAPPPSVAEPFAPWQPSTEPYVASPQKTEHHEPVRVWEPPKSTPTSNEPPPDLWMPPKQEHHASVVSTPWQPPTQAVAFEAPSQTIRGQAENKAQSMAPWEMPPAKDEGDKSSFVAPWASFPPKTSGAELPKQEQHTFAAPPPPQAHQPAPAFLDTQAGVDTLETMSVRSFANSTFAVDEGKNCFRCGKQNEMMANFCCRCGAQIGSPVVSPSASEICTSFSAVEETVSPAGPTDLSAQFGQMSLNQPVLSPHSPSKTQISEQRVFPVVSFGFGGRFALTFPSLQTRYNRDGQPITGYRPSLLYEGDVGALPQAQAAFADHLRRIDDGAPFLEKASKPKELASILSALKNEATDEEEKVLVGVLELILQSGGRPLFELTESLKKLLSCLPQKSLPFSRPLGGENQYASLKMADFLIAGDLTGAIDAAVEGDLWAHALAVGNLAGPQAYQKVLSDFSRSSFAPGHPLRLFFLSHSGASPQVIEEELHGCNVAENWSQIAMLSLVGGAKDFGILGLLSEALMKSGHHGYGQVCQLLAGREPTGLLGKGQFCHRFRLTELYEAIKHHHSQSYSIPGLLPFKLAFIEMCLDAGLLSEALRHCRALGMLLKRAPGKDTRFIEAYESLASRIDVLAEGNPTIAVPKEGDGSWLPKVSGFMDVLDRGLNKVIGMEEEQPKSRSRTPILPQIDVATEKQPPAVAPFQPTPVGGFDPFARRPSIESRSAEPPVPMAAPGQPFQPTQFNQFNQQPSQFAQPAAQLAQQSSQFTQPPDQFSQPPVSSEAFLAKHEQVTQPPMFGGSPTVSPTLPAQPAVGQPFQPFHQQQQPFGSFHGFQPTEQPGAQSPFFVPQQPAIPHAQPQGFDSPQLFHSPQKLPYQQSMPNLPNPSAEARSAAPVAASMDDFGIGNMPAAAAGTVAPPRPESAAPVAGADKVEDSDGGGSKSSSRLGFIWGIFGKKKDTASDSPALSTGSSSGPVKANLGESEMKLVYDENQKKWVLKDTGAPPVAEVKAPPPPTMASQPLGGEDGGPISYRRGQAGGARGKYVDAFGSGTVTAAPSQASLPNLIPTPSFGSMPQPSGASQPGMAFTTPFGAAPEQSPPPMHQQQQAPQNQFQSVNFAQPLDQQQPPPQQQQQQQQQHQYFNQYAQGSSF